MLSISLGGVIVLIQSIGEEGGVKTEWKYWLNRLALEVLLLADISSKKTVGGIVADLVKLLM